MEKRFKIMETGLVLQIKVTEKLSPTHRGRESSVMRGKKDGDDVGGKKAPTIWQQVNKKSPMVKSA